MASGVGLGGGSETGVVIAGVTGLELGTPPTGTVPRPAPSTNGGSFDVSPESIDMLGAAVVSGAGVVDGAACGVCCAG